MTNRLRLRCISALLFFLSLTSYQIEAQVFTGEKQTYQSPTLQSVFTAYEVFSFNAETLANYVKSNADGNTTLIAGAHTWNLSLVSSDLLSTTYTTRIETPQGIVVSHKRPEIAFKGYEQNGGKVRLTIDKDLIFGYIEQNGKTWRIEPLFYLEPGAEKGLFVVYEKSNIIPTSNVACGVTEEMEKAAKLDNDNDGPTGADFLAVYELELAVASDKLMSDAYGGPAGVIAHNIGVINDVEGDYTGNFNHDLCFDIVEQYVATSFPGPWTASNDADVLLSSFANWGNNGGFSVPFDMGELWSNRNFTGNTIGIAYLNGVCNNNKYHCLSDFGGNSEQVRCMTSHEIGHNFSAIHDNGCNNGPWIMCPSVSTSSQWSSQSSSSINAYMQSKINNGCLASCVQGPPTVAAFDWNPEPGCAGQAVQFTDQSTGTINSWSWTFVGGIPAVSSQQNPSVVFNTPGPHNVTLVANGPGGANSITQVVNIDPLPVASFTYTVNNLTLTFTNTSQNATTYLWEFGDGLESNEQDPVYTYAEAGTYVVKLTATNHCGSSVKTITINTFPTPDFTAEPNNGCATLTVQMQNESSANATSFQWTFPGGIPAASNLQNPVVLYSSSGNYAVTLVASNNVGSNTITKTNYIQVKTVPSPGFTFTQNGLTATFTNTSVNATSYLWEFGDNTTSTLANPVHTYATSGTYSVKLKATNDCGTTEITKTVSVEPPPVAAFTTSGNSGCAPLTVVFTNTSSGATSYSWALPGGNPATSTDANPTVVFDTPGTYTVTLTAANASGNSTATATITVITAPVTGFTSTNNGAVYTFTNTTTNGSTYAWAFGDGGNSTETNPVHTYATDGTYTVTLTATNACGTTTSTQTVSVVTPPQAGFTASPTSGCAALTVQYTNTSSANTTGYTWTFAGGDPATSTATNPTVVYNTPGVYSVTLVATNSAGNSTVVQNDFITVSTTAIAGFSSVTNAAVVTFTNTSSNATSYSWSFGDGNNSTEANPVHTYATDGTYTVVLSATNACGTVTTTQTVSIVTPPVASFNAGQTSGCVPFTVQFNNTSSSNATSYSWQFSGGDPATSTEQNPTVVYNVPGVYTVVLSVSNAAGTSTATQTDYISVGTIPSASFTSTVTASTATFTNTSVNGTTYAWDFGDNSNGTDANPTHTYANDGTYTVVLTATNNCGTSTFTQNVVVITEPEAGFTANTTNGCGPLAVQFSDLSSENTTSWSWSFPGGTPDNSTDENPSVVYATSGSYDVTLIATGPGGSNTYTQTNFITVNGSPVGSFTAAVNQNTASFTNTSVNATSYMWTFGDGSSSVEANPSHTYAADGTYTVILQATNNCGTTIVEQSVTITTAPVAAFTFNSSMGCAPLAVLFNNTSSNNTTSYSWIFEGGSPATSTDANPVTTWNTPGVYLVTLTASNGAGSSTATASITVNTVPTAAFTAQTAGLSVVLTNTTQNADSYVWTFGDGGTSTESNPTHTYAATGTYTVTLVATNGCGSITVTQEVTIAGSAPIAAFTSNLGTACAGSTIQFTDQSVGDPTGWAWIFDGGTPGTSTEQNPSVTYATPGTYDVKLEVTNLFGSAAAAQIGYITIVDLPTVGFTYAANNGVVDFSNTSQGGTSYAWDFGDNTTSTDANPSHTYTHEGTFTVTLTVTNVCGATSLQQTVVVVLVGTNDVIWLDQFRLYPNPNSGRFTVEMNGTPTNKVELALFNNLGQMVHTEIVDFGSGSLNKQFDFGGLLPAGLYTLRMQADGSAMYAKVVIQ